MEFLVWVRLRVLGCVWRTLGCWTPEFLLKGANYYSSIQLGPEGGGAGTLGLEGAGLVSGTEKGRSWDSGTKKGRSWDSGTKKGRGWDSGTRMGRSWDSGVRRGRDWGCVPIQGLRPSPSFHIRLPSHEMGRSIWSAHLECPFDFQRSETVLCVVLWQNPPSKCAFEEYRP